MTSTLQSPCDQRTAGPANTVSRDRDVLTLLEGLCACSQPRERAALVVRAFADGQADWQALLDAAGKHSVAPLVSNRLLEMPGGTLPHEWREHLREKSIGTARRNLLLTAELIRVLRAMEGGGLQAMPFKGPVLAEQAYGDISLRQFTDLDIVLPHSQIAEAHRLLENLEYRSESGAAAMAAGRIPGQYAYRNGSGSVLIEMHTERTMRYLPVPLDWKALSGRGETVSAGGQALRTFSVEDTMMMLCVHGTKHFWTRLGWICDIAQLAQAPRGIDWPRAAKLARKMRCHRMWLLGLALAHEILAAPLPEGIVREIHSDARVMELASRVREQYLMSGESGIGTGERVRFRANSQDTLTTGLRQLSIFATRPTDEDWESRSLPRWASPLYAILRPLRILRQYGLGRS
jgi:hypothetical protein